MPERGNKPGYYVVVSRQFVVSHDRIATVVCAPIYSEYAGISTEVRIGPETGVPRESAIRCDFLCLRFKSLLVRRVGALTPDKIQELDRALALALDLTPR